MTFSQFKNNKKLIYSLSFIVPVLLMILICFLKEVYPFGNNTLLIWDCSGQYADYLSYLKTFLSDNNNFIYTFSKNMGGDMVGLSAYYLFSPLNVIIFLFDKEFLPVAISLIIIIKIGLCGLTFNYFINKNSKAFMTSLLFSTSYALMAYNMAYFWNLMWLDGIILLPLIILGIDQILGSKKPYLYIATLALSLIINYYIGYMLCLFSGLYFLIKVIVLRDELPYLKRIITYFASSVIAVGLSAFVWLPTFMSLEGGKAVFSLSSLGFKHNYPFFDVIAKLFTGTIDSNQLMEGLPNIFCGLFILLLSILYFFNTHIKTKEKIMFAGLLTSLLLSFYINTFNLIWHGFNSPAWFPYRYSFIFSFLLIFIAYRSFINLRKGISYKKIILSTIILIFTSIYILNKNYSFIDKQSLYFDMLLIISFGILLYLFKRSNKKIVILMIFLLHLSNLSFNSYQSLSKLQAFSSSKMDSFGQYIVVNEFIIDAIKSRDNTFFRLEKTYERTKNDPMQFGYNGLSHFSSSEKNFVKTFLGKLGFRNNGNWAYYHNGSTLAVDSLLGVKYLLSDTNPNKPFEHLYTLQDITVLKNPYALPLGFAVSFDIFKDNLDTDDPFVYQNNVFKNMTKGQYENIFIGESSIVTTDNLSVTKNEKTTIYEKIDSSQDAYISYQITIDNPNLLYTYITAPQLQDAEIFINDQSLGAYFDIYRWDIVSLGSFKVDDIVTFKIKVKGDSLILNDIYFYYEERSILEKYYNDLIDEPCSIRKVSSSHLIASIDVLDNDKYALFTIPYEKDWKITIDGQKTKVFKVFDALMAVPVTKGQHTIELSYVPRGLNVGLGISLISLSVVLFYIMKHLK